MRNLKLRFISLAIVLWLVGGMSAYSQGFFKNAIDTEENLGAGNGGFRAPPDPSNEQNPENNANRTPVGEGFLILSLLSGGYFMLKRKNSKE